MLRFLFFFILFLENKNKNDAEELLGNELMNIDDNRYKQISQKVYKYAMNMLEKEGKQACEGLYHNLNTLESRAGSQLPFTSINFL